MRIAGTCASPGVLQAAKRKLATPQGVYFKGLSGDTGLRTQGQ